MRRRIVGSEAVAAALDAGEPLQVVLLAEADAGRHAVEVAARCEAQGVGVWRGSRGDLRRMTPGAAPADLIAMAGDAPEATLQGALARGGAVWLLCGAAYASNVGFSVRTAEVSGADAVLVEADFNHEERSRVRHVSMGADRLLPVLYVDAAQAVDTARAAGLRIVGLEDSGARAPWETDLTGAILLIVGNERTGIREEILACCDATIRIPMAGFVPSYNLQAALSAVAAERLRQSGAA